MPAALQPELKASSAGATEVILSSLESLPVEIQIAILAESSLSSLRALIRSSPRFYHVYFRHRLLILNKSLNNSLGGILQDAYAACWSDLWFGGYDAAAGVGPFSFEDYLESLLIDPTGSTIDDLSLTVARKMSYFHIRVVEPLTERYARWALGALSSSPEAAPLTGTEKAHIQRAMYRLQIICNIPIRDDQAIFEAMDAFGPWQAEEILCVHEFAKDRYKSVFVECVWHLDQPKYISMHLWEVEERPILYDYDLINDDALTTMLSLGLPVLQDSFEARNSGELVDDVRYSILSGDWVYRREWIDSAVWSNASDQDLRRQEVYTERDEAQDSQQKIQCEQDDLFSPPLAWVAFWGGRYSNLFGRYVPPALRRWGYVMWDAKRLEASGAMEFVELEWQCKYGVRGAPEEDDPREFYCLEYQRNAENGD
ncbi:hypothetical protein INS49_007832 [Diaporthe citri]|uniref:uncharacterized protein n=1 Tax=Diaporthe citri TaxID=83186 RepID=UPI001C7F02F5|nr:uncharacterized protein INS49_007832 [Diaporthe citri]KAG6362739.1 hypothetical protein INS49_007832 [Diaporthe citri]